MSNLGLCNLVTLTSEEVKVVVIEDMFVKFFFLYVPFGIGLGLGPCTKEFVSLFDCAPFNFVSSKLKRGDFGDRGNLWG